MSEKYIIAIDLGTTAEKCVIYNEEGMVMAEASEEITAYYPEPGAAEIKAMDFFTHTCSIIKKCISSIKIDAKNISVISIDSLQGGILGIDKKYNPVTYYDTAMNSRGGDENRYLYEKFGDLSLEQSGSYSIWGHKVLYWKSRNEYKDIYKFIHPTAFVAGKLAGLSGDDAFIDPSFLSFSAFSDLKKSQWSEEILRKLELDINKMPKVIKATEIIGQTTKEVKELTGLPEGVPICAGCGDVAAGLVGSGILSPGQIMDVSGTANIMCVNLKDFKYHPNFSAIKSPISESYYLMISHVLGGRTLKWFVDEFYPEKKEEYQKEGKNIYEFLDKSAESVPAGCGGMVAIDDLQGRFFPPYPNMRGLFIGHTWAHKKIYFYRAILESIAYDYMMAKEIMGKLDPDVRFDKITAIGSGSNSRIWLKIKADSMQTSFETLFRSDLSSLGAAVIGGYSVGLVKDIKSYLLKLLKVKNTVNPDMSDYPAYEKYYKVYKNLITGMNKFYDGIV
ncbi:MAG: FGGY-family carbohydrate kinase [Candidatus Humimicrobiaceae bacterium]